MHQQTERGKDQLLFPMALQKDLIKRELGKLSTLQPDRRWPLYQNDVREEVMDLIWHSLTKNPMKTPRYIVNENDGNYEEEKSLYCTDNDEDLIWYFKSSSKLYVKWIYYVNYDNRLGVTDFVVTVYSTEYSATFVIDFWCCYNKDKDTYEGNAFLSRDLLCVILCRTRMKIYQTGITIGLNVLIHAGMANITSYGSVINRRITLCKAYFNMF